MIIFSFSLDSRLLISHYSSVNIGSDQQVSPPRQALLVLCPNVQFGWLTVCGDNDFATSAVDFLHRVGPTARAGQFGLVTSTSMYTESNRELIDAVR
ncbi:hypothetical protein L6164_020656 [Bauhinia variegata]|uniref:Uncharacterized protein n=1 Tax=Bauhinia variegata TaxID=167791 RepID=A0ACB9MWJ5_BAUVA|nr:hypothetical protein L6164_020656 [Bauhinia variegata]